MFITISDGKAVVNEEGMALPFVLKVYKSDKTHNKAKFELLMRFVYHAYSKDSIYRNYLPKEREQKVVETLFPDKKLKYFKESPGMSILIKEYISMTYTFKELLYRRLLIDIEQMMDRLSKIELTKTARVKGRREIDIYVDEIGKSIKKEVDLDVRISIDNSEEKIKAMDILDKLLKREAMLKKALQEEKIEAQMKKQSEQRMFDK
jgi:hypothetical protein